MRRTLFVLQLLMLQLAAFPVVADDLFTILDEKIGALKKNDRDPGKDVAFFKTSATDADGEDVLYVRYSRKLPVEKYTFRIDGDAEASAAGNEDTTAESESIVFSYSETSEGDIKVHCTLERQEGMYIGECNRRVYELADGEVISEEVLSLEIQDQ